MKLKRALAVGFVVLLSLFGTGCNEEAFINLITQTAEEYEPVFDTAYASEDKTEAESISVTVIESEQKAESISETVTEAETASQAVTEKETPQTTETTAKVTETEPETTAPKITETTATETEKDTEKETEADTSLPLNGEITVEYLSKTVAKGNSATLKIIGKPNTKYTIEVYYSSGKSSAKGLEPKISDSDGRVFWTWKVGSRTKPGTYSIYVSDGESTVELKFNTI